MRVKLFDCVWDVAPFKHPTLGDGFEIDFTEEYDPPILGFARLKEISDYFGTNDIDIDNISERGCETCDHESRYGYAIQVYNATKNDPTKEATP